MSEALSRAKDWLSADPNQSDRRELAALIAKAESDDAEALADLEERFRGPLEFGTAGLRGVMGAGESRMNAAVVIKTTLGLVRYLKEHIESADTRGIVIGRDARLRSDELAEAAARVAIAEEIPVFYLKDPVPTPVVAFAVSHLGAAAGVVVTASHNPPEYNGYKVYLDNGAQIIPPHDRGIAEAIAQAPGANEIKLGPIEQVAPFNPGDLKGAYIDAVAELVRDSSVRDLKIAYTPLHGVGAAFARRALDKAGFSDLWIVPEQEAPDGRFPTVDFPNPEEPAALARLTNLARLRNADIAIANDPDADRLALLVRGADGEYVRLSGNEIGILLADHMLRKTASEPNPEHRLVMTTIVSTRQLSRMAKDLGVRYAETLTGFKWIANEAMRLERSDGLSFLFGFEEALGYTVKTVARDKDGIGAALVAAELAASLKRRGKTMLDRLEDIRRTHGLYLAKQMSLTLPGAEGLTKIREKMAAIRREAPTSVGGVAVEQTIDLLNGHGDLPPSNVVVFELAGGGRIAVRPSGTEPKLKLYVELASEISGDYDEAIAASTRTLEQMCSELSHLLGD